MAGDVSPVAMFIIVTSIVSSITIEVLTHILSKLPTVFQITWSPRPLSFLSHGLIEIIKFYSFHNNIVVHSPEGQTESHLTQSTDTKIHSPQKISGQTHF